MKEFENHWSRAAVSLWFIPGPGDFVLDRPLGGVLEEGKPLGVLGVFEAVAERDALALHSGEERRRTCELLYSYTVTNLVFCCYFNAW